MRWLLCTLACAFAGSLSVADENNGNPSPKFTQEEVSLFLEEAQNRLQKSAVKLSFASWDHNTNLTDFNLQKELEAQAEDHEVRKTVCEESKKFKASLIKDEVQRRLFYFLGCYSNPGENFSMEEEKMKRRRAKLFLEMKSIFSKAKVKDYHKRSADLSLEPDIYTIFTKSRDPAELEYYWLEWREATGKLMREKYIEQANISRRLFGQDIQEEGRKLEEEMEDVWLEIKPLYQQLHAYARNRLNQKYGDSVVNKTAPIPAHLFGNMWSQKWENIYDLLVPYPNKPFLNPTLEMHRQSWTPLKMFKVAENLFKSIGFEPLPESFWTGSMIQRPKDREVVCHASAWDMKNGKDFRIKMCTEVDNIYLHDIHHEMGHIYYDISFKDQPFLFRDAPDMGFHEASGDTIALTVETGKYQQQIGLLPKGVDIQDREIDLNILMNMAVQKIAFMPFGYLLEKFRWDVQEGRAQLENINCHWWKLRHDYQGIVPPRKRSYLDFDPGAKSHIADNMGYIRYVTAGIYQMQFYKTLCQLAGEYVEGDPEKPLHRCSIYGSKAAGDKIRGAFQLGRSVNMAKLLEIMTGQPKMDVAAFREYFRPLEKWLIEENKKNQAQVGWGEVDLEDVCEVFQGSTSD